MQEKKYTQEDIAMVLESFGLNHEEEYQRDMFVDILRSEKVNDLKKTADCLYDFHMGSPEQQEKAKAFLKAEYKNYMEEYEKDTVDSLEE